jgi:hypothetical protein
MSRILGPRFSQSMNMTTASAAAAPVLRNGNTLAPEYAALLVGRQPRASGMYHRTMFTTQNPARIPRTSGPFNPAASTIDKVVMPNLARAASSHAVASVPRLPGSPPSLSSSSSSASPTFVTTPIVPAGRFIIASDPSNVEPASILTSVQAMHCVDQQRRSSSPAAPAGGVLSSLVESLQEAFVQPEPARI